MYADARVELAAILAGRKEAGPATSFLEEAKKRQEEHAKKQSELMTVTPEEMGWDEDAGNQGND